MAATRKERIVSITTLCVEETELGLTILVAEPIRRPHTAIAIHSMDGINKAKALGLSGVLARVVVCAQKTRRHARPKCKDDEGEKVAHRHRPPPALVNVRAKGADHRPPVLQRRGPAMRLFKEVSLWPCRCCVEQNYEEQDGAGDVDEGVGPIGPPHQDGMGEEPLLNIGLDEDAEGLFPVDDFESMLARRVNRRFLERNSREGTA
jgi:hypothetical protein